MYIDKTYLNNYFPDLDTSRYSDPTISGIINQAQEKVNNFLGYSLDTETLTEKYDGIVDADSNIVVFTKKRPVQSVSSIRILKGTFNATVNLTTGNYDIPTSGDRIVIPTQALDYNTVSIISVSSLKATNFFVEVTYTAGYSTIPSSIQEACALYALDYFARKANLTGATSVSQGGISITYSDRRGKSDFIKDAEDMLQDYKRII